MSLVSRKKFIGICFLIFVLIQRFLMIWLNLKKDLTIKSFFFAKKCEFEENYAQRQFIHFLIKMLTPLLKLFGKTKFHKQKFSVGSRVCHQSNDSDVVTEYFGYENSNFTATIKFWLHYQFCGNDWHKRLPQPNHTVKNKFFAIE